MQSARNKKVPIKMGIPIDDLIDSKVQLLFGKKFKENRFVPYCLLWPEEEPWAEAI